MRQLERLPPAGARELGAGIGRASGRAPAVPGASYGIGRSGGGRWGGGPRANKWVELGSTQ